MQLALRRSQRKTGMLSKDVLFCLHAQVRLSGEERFAVDEYKLGKQIIYNSEKGREQLERSKAAMNDGKLLRGMAALARGALSLKLTIENLTGGKDIECKDLDEVLAAEAAIHEACENCKQYIAVAQSFDGSEQVVEIN